MTQAVLEIKCDSIRLITLAKKSFMFRFTIQLRTVNKSEGLSDNFQIVHFVTKITLIVVAPSMAKRPRTLTRHLLGGGALNAPTFFRRVITPVWRGAAAPNFR